jgi:hypothetical protein
MRMFPLSSVKTGMTRLRDKGGASAESLYELTNGYVDASRAPTQRPGTRYIETLPAATKGLMAFDGAFVTFSHAVQTMPAGYTCEVLSHPDDPAIPLAQIHFSVPFLGYPYVVAEFATGDVYHYWLQVGDTWAASTMYQEGDVIAPTTPNGLAYRAKRLAPAAPLWAAGIARAVGDVIEPTTANGYQYTVTDTIGDNPRSGTVEPVWPTEDGATIDEDAATGPADATTTDSTTPGLPSDVVDRYGTLRGFAQGTSE